MGVPNSACPVPEQCRAICSSLTTTHSLFYTLAIWWIRSDQCSITWRSNARATGCTIGLQDFPNLDGNFDYGPENMPLESTFGLGRRRGSKNKKRKGSTFFRALAPESKKSSKGKKKNRIALKSAASGRSLCSVQDHVNDYTVQIANSNFANIAFKESHQTGLRLEQPFKKIIKFIADVSSKCSNAEANCALIDASSKIQMTTRNCCWRIYANFPY